MAVAMMSSVAKAEVDLKGFKLEMTKKEFKKTWKSQRKKHLGSLFNLVIPHYTTSLAGVAVDKPMIWWKKKEGKKVVRAISFEFYYGYDEALCTEAESGLGTICSRVRGSSANFIRVVEAIKQKYPGFECTESDLMNKMGAEWKNRKCVYHNGDGVSISTIRYRNNKDYGTITILPTNEYVGAKEESKKEFNTDL